MTMPGPTPRSDRTAAAWRWLGLLPALAIAAAILLARVPPFTDVPYHLATAAIRVDYDRTPDYAYYYAVGSSIGPNALFNLLAVWSGHPLAALPILLASSVVANALLILALARRFRTGPLFPLIAGPFAIHASLSNGFVEFAIGVPFALAVPLLLAVAPERSGRPLAKWAMALVGLSLLTFVAHAIVGVFVLLILGVFALLMFARDRRVSIAAALATVPMLLAFVAWRSSRDDRYPTEGFLTGYYARDFLREWPTRIYDVLTVDHGKLVSPAAGPWIGGAMIAVAVAATLGCRLVAPIRADDDRSAPARAAVRAFAITAFLVVLFAPPGFPPIWGLYHRFVFAAVIGGALLATSRAGPAFAPRTLVALLAVVNVTIAGLWFEHVYSFRRHAADLLALSQTPGLDGVGAYVVGDRSWRNERLALTHAGDVLTAYGGLPMMSELYDFPFTKIRRGPGLGRDYYLLGVSALPSVDALLPMFDNYGFALVHASAPDAGRDELARRAPIVTRRGDWTIYARAPATRPTVTGTGP